MKVLYSIFLKVAWASRSKEKDSNIEMVFLLAGTTDKNFIIITFYSFSRGSFYIKTSQCSANEISCVVEEMRKSIDEVVIKSMIQDGN